MAPEKSVWDHAADKDLLLTLIDQKTLDWVAISGLMTDKGYTFTKEACRQHFQKIRRESRQGTTNGSSNGTGAAPTPSKRGANSSAKATPTKPKGTPNKKASFTNSSTNGSFNGTGYAEDNDDDVEELMSPIKRMKMMKKEENGIQQTAPVFKAEDLGGNGVVDLEHDDLYDDDDQV